MFFMPVLRVPLFILQCLVTQDRCKLLVCECDRTWNMEIRNLTIQYGCRNKKNAEKLKCPGQSGNEQNLLVVWDDINKEVDNDTKGI